MFRDLPDLLQPGDLLIVNRSRVFPARLIGRRPGGGQAEILLIERLDAGSQTWTALVRPARRLPPGASVQIDAQLSVTIESGPLEPDGRRRVRVRTSGEDPALAIERTGHTPLPPYIHRPDTASDRERYQTVYAQEPGSVAAPTAGLHLTEALLQRLAERGIARAEVLLHVGPSTFRPVTAEQVEDHRVAPEPFQVPHATAEAIRQTRARRGRVVAVGTTAVRALETAALASGEVVPMKGRTDLVAVPGFHFRVVDALLTNFHLPRSSLLLLVSAFADRQRVLSAYAEAVRLGYRFYSYGDAMLIV